MSTIGCIQDKYKHIVIGTKRIKTVVQSVEGLNLLRVRDLIFRHEAHHLTPGHLAHGTLFYDLAILFFTEYAGDEAHILR